LKIFEVVKVVKIVKVVFVKINGLWLRREVRIPHLVPHIVPHNLRQRGM
jgi:hypothetical protein